MSLDNAIYKNTVLAPLGKALQLSSSQYIQKFSAALQGEESDLIFQALETAGLSRSEGFGVVPA